MVWITDILNSVAIIRMISTEKKQQTFAKTSFFYSAGTGTLIRPLENGKNNNRILSPI